MSITETFILILLLTVAALAVVVIEDRRHFKKKIKEITIKNREFLLSKPDMDYDMLKEILDTVISDVIIDINLRFEMQEIKYIRNIHDETLKATTEVMDLVSDNILEQLKCYVSEKYIIQYISRNFRGYFINYLKEKNVQG